MKCLLTGLLTTGLLLIVTTSSVLAREYHVSTSGNDQANGSAAEPVRNIAAAVTRARPGDVITIHEGVYRERINPQRGGESDALRITYRAAPGEKVVVKGSEVVRGWKNVGNDTWKVTVPNRFFGDFNPYSDVIHGDWFNPKGRKHHTGAVYLNGHWLTEAAEVGDVLKPIGDATSSYTPGGSGTLLNVAWLRPDGGAKSGTRVPAASFAAQHGVSKAPCSEGGECIGWIERGDWVRYEGVDFGAGTEDVEFRAASVTTGGRIELRLDTPDGELLGTCAVPNTGGWQSWSSFHAKVKPTSGKKSICLLFKEPGTSESGAGSAADLLLWFAEVGDSDTTIWAQFKDVDPNEAEVEINVRQTVFYPDKPGVNFITVRGLTMLHAATPWAPPTAEQIGLIGTHWSKGWIIENCDIRYSTCVGIALGKHGDQWDNTSANTAVGYVKTIERAIEQGWSKENIGHHVVRNNHISNCEQAGIVGSLGAIFSSITGNVIHDIHVRRLFTGAEMAGIKIHAAIDMEISRNHIYHTCRGIWLDWMAQGTHVTRNLLHDNGPSEDLFVEVDHGPFMVDHNLFLSPIALLDVSQGGAFAHNLFAGRIVQHPELRRETPYHLAHSVEIAGLRNIAGGDNRFFNNVFVGFNGLAPYDKAAQPSPMAGNVFLKGAQPSRQEQHPVVEPEYDPNITLVMDKGVVLLQADIDELPDEYSRPLVTTELLGRAKSSNLPYEQPNGEPYRLDTDYFGKQWDTSNIMPGPFALQGSGRRVLKVWPADSPD